MLAAVDQEEQARRLVKVERDAIERARVIIALMCFQTRIVVCRRSVSFLVTTLECAMPYRMYSLAVAIVERFG